MFTQDQIQEIKSALNTIPGRVYMGCDSMKYKKHKEFWARYTVVFILHIENAHGCKIWGFNDFERDYDPKKDKPRMRLMNETYKVAGAYLELADELEDREVEIHLDVNPNEKHGSSIVFKEAVGYILGMTGIQAKTKPESWAATHAADHLVRGKG